MQNEFSSIYLMWGYDAFFKFHREADYESKREGEKSAVMRSIQNILRSFESRKI